MMLQGVRELEIKRAWLWVSGYRNIVQDEEERRTKI
jgi:hypothetical protein